MKYLFTVTFVVCDGGTFVRATRSFAGDTLLLRLLCPQISINKSTVTLLRAAPMHTKLYKLTTTTPTYWIDGPYVEIEYCNYRCARCQRQLPCIQPHHTIG